ncbi:MAG: D-glycero-beta-D-manno-heptose 1-phosphate adenylyltransferase [Fimbriimonas ginsengisoli]|uniref:D-glycero-beta-D-manno-heptose 1-phosphate adenylyltransferase n=1 Tax=Fimbriimonas ginsengisoli TaxID=1005039 RepID=A0A931LWZ0_FIMGI|nr:D-glycero-beta-D-manno-heptose 1-phosphate adenylyltransferase [Fimbriimonas ginsengisoli]MBI3721820.1 D-glycero-beta-D-manno-heptose 1-phosphate adenylyltransferase [Fimbriimonas ginsengisoli]
MSLSRLETALKMRDGKRLVFTNGVFDVLHAGHVRYLAQARALGDLLVVGLNSDLSARRLGKHPNRPVNGIEDRAEVLAALKSVDLVVSFDEDTPELLIEALKPEFHVKGGDYRADELAETPLVESYGGQVVIVPLLQGRSTSDMLRKLGVT